MNSLLSMVMPGPETITCPSFLQVMRIGMSPEETTHGMYRSCPMEAGGNSKGWIRGGTVKKSNVLDTTDLWRVEKQEEERGRPVQPMVRGEACSDNGERFYTATGSLEVALGDQGNSQPQVQGPQSPFLATALPSWKVLPILQDSCKPSWHTQAW